MKSYFAVYALDELSEGFFWSLILAKNKRKDKIYAFREAGRIRDTRGER